MANSLQVCCGDKWFPVLTSLVLQWEHDSTLPCTSLDIGLGLDASDGSFTASLISRIVELQYPSLFKPNHFVRRDSL